jgi:integrase/recombinase XerD
MEAAPERGSPGRVAMRFRDGLLVCMLAACPLRTLSMIMLTLEESFVREASGWWVRLPGSATKTGKPFAAPLPEEMNAGITAYLTRHRPVLLARRSRRHRLVGRELWVTADGAPMTRIYEQVVRVTRQAFSKSVNPHLFRDCAAGQSHFKTVLGGG